jgi:hypothetical protein
VFQEIDDERTSLSNKQFYPFARKADAVKSAIATHPFNLSTGEIKCFAGSH